MGMHDDRRGSIDLVVMVGKTGASYPEQIIGRVREAIALDTIEKGLAQPQVRQVVVSSSSTSFLELVSGMPVNVIPDEAGIPFHFGRQIHSVIKRAGLDRVLYVGGGACPLLSPEQLEALIAALLESPDRLVTNNLYSADIVGFPAQALDRIELPSRDNDLAWTLAQLGGFDVRQPPRSAGTSFDIDTITDVQILKMCSRVGPHTAAALRGFDLDTSRLQAALSHLRDPSSALLLVGRASSDVWRMLNERAACTVRVIVEERGMRASGRLARGEVRSLVGVYMQQYGFAEFFQEMARATDAMLIDTRVLYAHLGPWPGDADRAYSDLCMPELISAPAIRQLTEAAKLAPMPVVLGGHTLMSGGLLALLEAVGL